ncbi:MAG TPA: SagB/ThcOx family dehydrogenase [Bryobacteraceae bacterium]|nr:SagB/ThcOx family dehydrogenase [Bryobacteraceae bacterium]
MPDPFREYEGVPVLDLPADPPCLDTPALDVLGGLAGSTTVRDGATFLSQLLYSSAAISASKRVPSTGYRYALRVNPSSGNLHPTEFHFRTRGLRGWPDGFYHYRPSAHMAEQRALDNLETKLAGSAAPIVLVLTTIAWREAWKYRDRAYRYCLHDIGHAWQALVLAARAMGCDSFATGRFPDDEIARISRVHDDEWPMLIVELQGRTIPVEEPGCGASVWYGGHPNYLSRESITYPSIEAIHAATKLSPSAYHAVSSVDAAPRAAAQVKLPPPAFSMRTYGEVARTRRSALNFRGGTESMSMEQLSAILTAASRPLFADFAGERYVQLYLYAHRVTGLELGVYRFWPECSALELIRPGVQCVAIAGLSLGQDLAGNACVAFSMIGDLRRAVRLHGDRGYRYVHFEAGAIGHRLYVSAEALGLGATGIGAFFDDEVHRYLNLDPDLGQVVYHFAIGYPVPDPRIEA